MSIAVAWIRDGTLVDRMAENSVAFAMASSRYSPPGTGPCDLTEFVQWGFDASGVSAREKMDRYNRERGGRIDVERAAAHYDLLSTAIGEMDLFFPGAKEALRAVIDNGGKNYITSAATQSMLDRWLCTSRGKEIAPYLEEVLGERGESFTKGGGHFSYLRERYDHIYLVADAEQEMSIAKRSDPAIIRVGFAHAIAPPRVCEAFEGLARIEEGIAGFCVYDLDAGRLRLPGSDALAARLTAAGANVITGGSKEHIMGGVRCYLSAVMQEHRGTRA